MVVESDSHGVVKWARVVPTSKSVMITTTCELIVVGVVVVHAFKKYDRKISIWLAIALPLQSYSYCGSHHININNQNQFL